MKAEELSMESLPVLAIRTAWSTIETFVNLPTTVAMAQSCTSMHKEIIDVDTTCVKVSHFEDREWKDSADYFEEEGRPPYDRIPNYFHGAAEAIHFPSLRSISLKFSFTIPLFLPYLRHAVDLEQLKLDFTNLVLDETDDKCGNTEDPRLLGLIEHSLERCSKLTRITIFNQTCIYDPFSMRKVMLIPLTQTLDMLRDTLQELVFTVCTCPSDNFNGVFNNDDQDVAFFRSMLNLTQLTSLELNIPHSNYLTDAFLTAARQMLPKPIQRPEEQNEVTDRHHYMNNLQCLRVFLFDMNGTHFHSSYPGLPWPFYDIKRYHSGNNEGIDIFLRHCLSTSRVQLQTLGLGLPAYMWDANFDSWAIFLQRLQGLSTLNLHFGYSYDRHGQALELLNRCLFSQGGDECNLDFLEVDGLKYVDGRQLSAMLRKSEGMSGEVKLFRVIKASDYHGGLLWSEEGGTYAKEGLYANGRKREMIEQSKLGDMSRVDIACLCLHFS